MPRTEETPYTDGANRDAPFTLRVHRGEGMALLAMSWRDDRPPDDFAGFAIEYRTGRRRVWQAVPNRIGFDPAPAPKDGDPPVPSLEAPIQKFRWVHFPPNAMSRGERTNYRVTPMFMDDHDQLSAGAAQEATIDLGSETYPGILNVAFTRGFVSSQAFVHHFTEHGESFSSLVPRTADEGLGFTPTHPKADEAYAWMGFEARAAVLAVLDEAIDDPKAQVRVVAYDLNLPELMTRLERLGKRVKVIIDDSDDHGAKGSAENAAEKRLLKSAGGDGVRRMHMGDLQHNKMIVVDGPQAKAVVWGSTNFSWRGFYVQSNNAVVVRTDRAVQLGADAFDDYWNSKGDQTAFEQTASPQLASLELDGIDAQVTFSPHADDTAQLDAIGRDIGTATSSVLYSLAFLSQTKGSVRNALRKATNDDNIFVYGIADKPSGGIALHTNAGGNPQPVSPAALSKNVPEPFKSEPSGGSGIRMHHKFVVLDFDQPTARVWLGSYNFSEPADLSNGENLLIIRNRRVATSYMVEALRIFDHYRFRVVRSKAKRKGDPLVLRRPPRKRGQKPWFDGDYTDPVKIRDRELFSGVG
jgi:phosphatidylserine/phosphatidylglycerophosphate/cardiolipin synthase-like enzyme